MLLLAVVCCYGLQGRKRIENFTLELKYNEVPRENVIVITGVRCKRNATKIFVQFSIRASGLFSLKPREFRYTCMGSLQRVPL